MIVERAELAIVAGKEEQFAEAMWAKGLPAIAAANGCLSVGLARGVESPGTFLLLAKWNSLDDHIAFTETPEFAELGALIGPMFSDAPQVAHFEFV